MGYDARGEEKVVAVLGLQQTRVVTSCVLPNNEGVIGLTESDPDIRRAIDLAHERGVKTSVASFDLVLDVQSRFGNRNAHYSSDSALLSKEGRFVFVSNLGGIRAMTVEGETVDRVENEVGAARRRDV